MAKKKITNIDQDRLLLAAGRGKVLESYGFFKSKIKSSEDHSVKIKVLSSEIVDTDESIKEVVKIRIDAVDKARSRQTIRRAIPLGSDIRDYTTSIPELIDLNDTQDSNITLANPSYSVDVGFNYVSQDYDNLQSSIDEHNLNSFIDMTSKDEILNFRKRKNANIANFTRGSKMKNFVMPNQGSKILNEVPYYIRTNINDSIKGDVSKFLQKVHMFDEVLNAYLNSPKTKLNLLSQIRTNASQESFDSYDISTFFNSDVQIDLDNFYGLNEGGYASKMSLDLRKHLFKGYLKKATDVGFRTFEEIKNGAECHKEAFAYSLEKFDEFEVEAGRLQNLFVPAGYDNARFIDTQVKYGKTYMLRCKAHYMIVGNSYRYSNLRFFKEDDVVYATAEVTNQPKIVIIPSNIFRAKKTVIQPPPTVPQVTFKTENDSTKEIQFYFSPTPSESHSGFTSILLEDDQQRELMDRFFSSGDGTYRFQSYSESGLYEVFRLSYPPKSYGDFSNAKLAETRMPFMTGDAILRDMVMPNEDYYYTFRQVNQKGLVSNPTRVFKVRLVVDADDANVMVEEYNFPKKITSQDRADFKSIIQIMPSTEQTLLNEAQDALYEKTSAKGTLDGLELGMTRHKVWGRKIKLRFRSKTSGKMIDVNVHFNLRKNKTKEEF
jgi:hypothetical protein